MCGCDNYDGPSVYHAEMRRARFAYKCEECREPIAPREMYCYVTGCWEGRWDTFRECAWCQAIRHAFHDAEGCWPSHGNLIEEVFECLNDLRRCPPDERDEDAPSPLADPVSLKFGVSLRRHLGRMGPRRAVQLEAMP